MSKKLLFVVLAGLVPAWAAAKEPANAAEYSSAFLCVQLAPDQPAWQALSVDSLGKSTLGPSPLRAPAATEKNYVLHRAGSRVEYWAAGAAKPAWIFDFAAREIRLRSSYSKRNPPPHCCLISILTSTAQRSWAS